MDMQGGASWRERERERERERGLRDKLTGRRVHHGEPPALYRCPSGRMALFLGEEGVDLSRRAARQATRPSLPFQPPLQQSPQRTTPKATAPLAVPFSSSLLSPAHKTCPRRPSSLQMCPADQSMSLMPVNTSMHGETTATRLLRYYEIPDTAWNRAHIFETHALVASILQHQRISNDQYNRMWARDLILRWDNYHHNPYFASQPPYPDPRRRPCRESCLPAVQLAKAIKRVFPEARWKRPSTEKDRSLRNTRGGGLMLQRCKSKEDALTNEGLHRTECRFLPRQDLCVNTSTIARTWERMRRSSGDAIPTTRLLSRAAVCHRHR